MHAAITRMAHLLDISPVAVLATRGCLQQTGLAQDVDCSTSRCLGSCIHLRHPARIVLSTRVVTDLETWIAACRKAAALAVDAIAWTDCRNWELCAGAIQHDSGGFFSVVGVEDTQSGARTVLLDQREVGLLAFLIRERNERIEWLLQAKTEPGNVGEVQIGPTVQATESNYKRRHGGRPTRYLDWFLDGNCRDERGARVMLDCLQSEHGTRFYHKHNRNMVVRIGSGDEDEHEDDHARRDRAPRWWRWVSSRQLRDALATDYRVNTDARSVLVSAPWSLLSDGRSPFTTSAEAPAFQAALAEAYQAEASALDEVERLLARTRRSLPRVRLIDVQTVTGWRLTSTELRCLERPELSIAPFRVHVTGREVPQWDQPLYRDTRMDEISLLGARRDGVLKFFFRVSAEIGLPKAVELGPSWQSSQSRDRDSPPSFWAAVATEDTATVRSVEQSDEGGRFYRACANYRIVHLPASDVPSDEYLGPGVWLTPKEIDILSGRPDVFNNEARSALSVLLSFV